MIWNFFRQLLFEKKATTFISSYNLPESIRHLEGAIVKQSWFPFTRRSGVTGKVNKRQVVLYHIHPHINNSFIQYFYGQWREEEKGTVLYGYFSMATSVRLFMAFWFGFLCLFSAVSIIFAGILGNTSLSSTLPPQMSLLLPMLISVGMFLFGIGLVKIGKWLARDDVTKISEAVKSALQSNES